MNSRFVRLFRRHIPNTSVPNSSNYNEVGLHKTLLVTFRGFAGSKATRKGNPLKVTHNGEPMPINREAFDRYQAATRNAGWGPDPDKYRELFLQTWTQLGEATIDSMLAEGALLASNQNVRWLIPEVWDRLFFARFVAAAVVEAESLVGSAGFTEDDYRALVDP